MIIPKYGVTAKVYTKISPDVRRLKEVEALLSQKPKLTQTEIADYLGMDKRALSKFMQRYGLKR